MANQGLRRSRIIQGLPLEEDYPPFPPPNNPTHEGSIEESIGFDMDNVYPLNHQEGLVQTIEEFFISPENPPLTNPLGPTLDQLPSSNSYLDQISIFQW